MDAYQSAVPRGAYLRCSWGSVSMHWKRNRVLRVATKRGTHYLLWQPWLPLYQATLVRGAFGASNTNASRYAISGLLFLSSFSDLVPYGNTPLCIYEPSRLDQAQGALQLSQRITERALVACAARAGSIGFTQGPHSRI